MKDVQKYPDTPMAGFFAEKCLEAAVEEGAVIATLVKEDKGEKSCQKEKNDNK